jgi:predicted metalloprotease
MALELHADCLLGVWAHAQYPQSALGLIAVKQTGRALVAASELDPDASAEGMHGTGAKRRRWFKNGFESGVGENCDDVLVPVAA